jgi:hypothetical protein
MKIIRYLLDGLGHDKIVFLEMLPYASQYINTACEKNNYVEIETEEKYENDVIEKVEYLRRVLTSNDMKSKREISIKNIKESTSNELLNQQNIFGKLIEEGFIVPICNGVYAYGGIFLHVFNYFCEKINMFGKKSFSSIVEYEVPAIFPIDKFAEGKYFENFPHHIMFQTVMQNDIKAHGQAPELFSQRQAFIAHDLVSHAALQSVLQQLKNKAQDKRRGQNQRDPQDMPCCNRCIRNTPAQADIDAKHGDSRHRVFQKARDKGENQFTAVFSR